MSEAFVFLNHGYRFQKELVAFLPPFPNAGKWTVSKSIDFHVFLRNERVVLRGVSNCAGPETAQYFAWKGALSGS